MTLLDTRNNGRTCVEFLATPRGIQVDAIQDDAVGSESSSPDFYWDSVASGDPGPDLKDHPVDDTGGSTPSGSRAPATPSTWR